MVTFNMNMPVTKATMRWRTSCAEQELKSNVRAKQTKPEKT